MNLNRKALSLSPKVLTVLSRPGSGKIMVSHIDSQSLTLWPKNIHVTRFINILMAEEITGYLGCIDIWCLHCGRGRVHVAAGI